VPFAPLRRMARVRPFFAGRRVKLHQYVLHFQFSNRSPKRPTSHSSGRLSAPLNRG
jgi:hypothetical protein